MSRSCSVISSEEQWRIINPWWLASMKEAAINIGAAKNASFSFNVHSLATPMWTPLEDDRVHMPSIIHRTWPPSFFHSCDLVSHRSPGLSIFIRDHIIKIKFSLSKYNCWCLLVSIKSGCQGILYRHVALTVYSVSIFFENEII